VQSFRMSDTEKETAHSLISLIDCEEADHFLQAIDGGLRLFTYRFFDDDIDAGVFVSFLYSGMLRIDISFSSDTDKHTNELVGLVNQSIAISDCEKAVIWLRNESKKIIDGLHGYFNQGKTGYDYNGDIEFIMRREDFVHIPVAPLKACGYVEERFDFYSDMLDEALGTLNLSPQYRKNRLSYREKFRLLEEQKSFESFWIDDELIGLYWRSGAHINNIAVSKRHQSNGYGRKILSRAIENVFKSTTAPFAYLYCADWNDKAIRFYSKMLMQRSGYSYRMPIR
jgi:GNAT superfamily N-acetyltransferase